MSSTRGKLVGVGLVAAVIAALAFVGIGPALAAGPVYPVMNTSETPPDGVWFRDDPNVSGPRLNGYGVYRGDRVELMCYGWGQSLGPYANRLWYYSRNTTRPSAPGRENVGWLNAHYVDDRQNANVVAPGVGACGGTPTPPPPPPTPPSPSPSPSDVAYGAPCAKTVFIVVPGSNETSERSAPNAQVGMLQNVTGRYAGASSRDIRVHYIGYPSQLSVYKPIYDASRAKGYQAAFATIKGYVDKCYQTKPKFVLLGYSQGAHVIGDLTATIGKQAQPIASDRLLATALLADPARDQNFQTLTGTQEKGGNGIVGSRSDFGTARSKVTEYCIAHDSVCDVGGRLSWGRAAVDYFRAGPHQSYQYNWVPGTSTPFTTRIADDLRRFF